MFFIATMLFSSLGGSKEVIILALKIQHGNIVCISFQFKG